MQDEKTDLLNIYKVIQDVTTITITAFPNAY